MQIEDIPCTRETMRQLTSLGRNEMPDAARIADFDYHPPAEDYEAVPKGTKAREAAENDEASPTVQDPLIRQLICFSCITL